MTIIRWRRSIVERLMFEKKVCREILITCLQEKMRGPSFSLVAWYNFDAQLNLEGR